MCTFVSSFSLLKSSLFFFWQPIGFVLPQTMLLPPNPFSRLLLAGIILSLILTIHMWAAPGWAAAPAPSPTQRSPHGPLFHATPVSPPTPRWTAPNPKTTSSSPSSPASVLPGQSTSWDLFTPSWYVEPGPFESFYTQKRHKHSFRRTFTLPVWTRCVQRCVFWKRTTPVTALVPFFWECRMSFVSLIYLKIYISF